MAEREKPLLTKPQLAFLEKLEPFTAPVPRSALLRGKRRLVEREEERARRECKRMGLVEFVGGRLEEGKDFPMGWRLTHTGRATLFRARLSRGEQRE